MNSTQDLQTKHNAAWRAFWIKIRELDARETDSRKEACEDDKEACEDDKKAFEDNHLEPSSAADGSSGLTTSASEKGKGNP